MARTQDANPTEREVEILRVLWDLGPSTVREVHRALTRETETGTGRAVGRTTILKLMQIMHDKGLLARDDSDYRHVYRPAQAQEVVEARLVARLVENVFAGSAMNLVARALDAKPVSHEELAELRRLIEEASAKGHP